MGEEMRILAIDPGFQWIEGKQVSRVYPRIGFAYIATVLSTHHAVTVIDVSATQMSSRTLVEIMKKITPEMVCITSVAFHHGEACATGHLVQKICPGVPVVYGGAHCTALFEEFARIGDCVVLGEGESTIMEIADHIQQGLKDWEDIPGIAFNSESECVVTSSRKHITELDSLPFPDWSLYDYSQYLSIPSENKNRPIHFYSINSMRGCPYDCSFCSDLHGTQVRHRSSESVVNEMEYNRDTHDAHHFDFADSNMTVDKELFLELCTHMVERDLGVLWNMETRVDLVDEEIVTAAHQAGCQVICYGIESGSDCILKKMGKSYSLDQIEAAVQMATEAGLLVKSSFILGHPFETAESVEETFTLARNLRKTYGMDSYCGLVDVYPHTRLHHMAENEDGCWWVEGMRENWDAIQRNTATVETDDLSRDQLESLLHRFTNEIDKIPSKDYYRGKTKGNTKENTKENT
jgi:radical SAM superfamily enzyme YgiQ (UPF0313 family)